MDPMLKRSLAALAVSGLLFKAVGANATVIDTATYGDHTYYLLDYKSWTASEAEAVSIGGHLVTVNDGAENAWLNSQWGQQRTLWIGFFRNPPRLACSPWACLESARSAAGRNKLNRNTIGTLYKTPLRRGFCLVRPAGRTHLEVELPR